jgi:uncharacterized protein YkwD
VLRIARRAALVAALAATFVGVPLAIAAPASAATSTTTLESQVMSLLNTQRVAHGCAPLRTDSRLRSAARAHSLDMVQKAYFSHTGSDGSNFVTREVRAGYPSAAASAENIAWGYSASSLVTAWMNSPVHRTNILDCASRAGGVGMAYSGSTPYWTHDFGRS